jgi:hypothetical protein
MLMVISHLPTIAGETGFSKLALAAVIHNVNKNAINKVFLKMFFITMIFFMWIRKTNLFKISNIIQIKIFFSYSLMLKYFYRPAIPE